MKNWSAKLLFELKSYTQSNKELEQQLPIAKSGLSSKKFDDPNLKTNNKQWIVK